MFVEQSGNKNGGSTMGGGGGGAHLDKNMTPLARRVLIELNTQIQSNEGLHVDQLSRNLGIKASEVLKGCDDLLAMGSIYTTVDDNTFAVLDF